MLGGVLGVLLVIAQGYLGVLNPLFTSGKYVKVGEPAGTWTPTVALSEFQQNFTAHKNINSVLTPNDANAAPIERRMACCKRQMFV